MSWSTAASALSVVFASVLATACADTRWTNPASDAARTTTDLQECDNAARIEAQQRVMFERLSGPRVVRNGVIGYPTGGGFYERNSEWYWSQQFLDACMRRKGYRLVRVE